MSATFYLGTHRPMWLERDGGPWFVSRRLLAGRKTLPRAAGPWALDSGGFTELAMYGGWQTTAARYVCDVRRFHAEIGNLRWVAPQDWMCEPSMIAKTGLDVATHQRLTIENYLYLREGLRGLVIPVVQGWERDDYSDHVEQYRKAGVDLAAEPLVGVGSICRRDADDQITGILGDLIAQGLTCHGFGLKGDMFVRFADRLGSADSMAWSATARRDKMKLPGCEHRGPCGNCYRWACRWRDSLVRRAEAPRLAV